MQTGTEYYKTRSTAIDRYGTADSTTGGYYDIPDSTIVRVTETYYYVDWDVIYPDPVSPDKRTYQWPAPKRRIRPAWRPRKVNLKRRMMPPNKRWPEVKDNV
jgi:hypothetical protein